MRRGKTAYELDFDNINVAYSLDAHLVQIQERLRAIQNPWTGNKRKLIGDIVRMLDKNSIEYETVLDLFSGSAMVSIAMKKLGKTVHNNDLLAFPYFNARAFVENHQCQLTEEDKSAIFDGDAKGDGFIESRYTEEDARFTVDEAKSLDRLYANAKERFNSSSDIRFVLFIVHILHYVMQRCFVGGRLNNGQVLASLEHRLGHQRNKGMEMSFKGIRWVDMQDKRDEKVHVCTQLDAKKLLDSKPDVDLAYIDPPYGDSQSDYSYMYSFFEEYIARLPINEIFTSEEDKRFSRHDGYCNEFRILLSAASYIPTLLFSYNDSSWTTLDDILSIIKRYRRKVLVEKVEYKYNYRDRSNKDKSEEYLILAT